MHRRSLSARTFLAAAGLVIGLVSTACQPTAAKAPSDPDAFSLADFKADPSAARGSLIYQDNCVGCHGAAGEGDGPGSTYLNPLPRNFQSGKFKFRSTASGELPTIDDVVRTVTCGLPGSAMPGFSLIPDSQRRDVAAYVLHLAAFGRARRLVASMIESEGLTIAQIRSEKMPEIRTRAFKAGRIVVAPPEPEVNEEGLRRGKTLYEAQCIACHGPGGRGDGVSSDALRDWQDASIAARDFTAGVFRSGQSPSDLFLRMRTGLNGTPMPSMGVTDAELWDIVHYVISLKRPGVTPLTRRMGCSHEGGAQ